MRKKDGDTGRGEQERDAPQRSGDHTECRSREGSLSRSVGMRFAPTGGSKRRRRGRERERGKVHSCRVITVAEVQTSREFERRPVAVGASATTRRWFTRT